MDEKKQDTVPAPQVQELKKSNASEGGAVIKQTLAEFRKSHKKLCRALIAVLVVIVLLFAAVGIIGSDGVRVRLINSLIPDEIYNEQVNLTFYSEANPDFDSDIDGEDYFAMYKCYYYPGNDTSGTKIYVNDNGMLYLGDIKVDVSTGFILAGLQRVSKIVDALKYIAIALIIAVIAVLIYVWYRADKKSRQAQKKKIRNHK